MYTLYNEIFISSYPLWKIVSTANEVFCGCPTVARGYRQVSENKQISMLTSLCNVCRYVPSQNDNVINSPCRSNFHDVIFSNFVVCSKYYGDT